MATVVSGGGRREVVDGGGGVVAVCPWLVCLFELIRIPRRSPLLVCLRINDRRRRPSPLTATAHCPATSYSAFQHGRRGSCRTPATSLKLKRTRAFLHLLYLTQHARKSHVRLFVWIYDIIFNPVMPGGLS